MGLKEKLSYFIQDFFIPSLTDRDYEFSFEKNKRIQTYQP